MRKLAACVLVAILVFAACGDDDDDTSTGSGDASGSGSTAEDAPVTLEGQVNNHGTEDLGSGDELQLEADDFYFGPTFVKAEAGKTVKVEIKNEGDATHTFTIDGTDVDVEVPAGEDAEAEVELPESGATRFYCRFHSGQGMQGAFFFNEGDKVGASTGSSGGKDDTEDTSGGIGY